jgi:transcriptional regulator with XRE-family HTH domain
MPSFGERLKLLRKKHGLTQVAIAKIANISDRAVRQFESGKNNPNFTVLVALSMHFGVSLDWLCCISEDPTIHNPIAPTDEEAAVSEPADI